MVGYEAKPPLKGGDAARLSAYDRIELNKHWALGRGTEPTTFPARDLDFTQHTTLALAPTT